MFAFNEDNFLALHGLGRYKVPGKRSSETLIDDNVDLTTVGNTATFRTKAGVDGHWRMNGGAISLPELFDKFGDRYTVSELMFWYYNAPKVLRKREHAWGSPDCRKAALQRWKTYGRPGHRSDEILQKHIMIQTAVGA